MTDMSSIDKTLLWLMERKENCARLAGLQTGTAREGWLEDGAYFAHAFSLIRREYRPHRTTTDYEESLKSILALATGTGAPS